MKRIKTRFAPSPSGHLHLGGARTAIFNYWLAIANGGSFMVRVDDTNPGDQYKLYLDSILASLKWLKLLDDQVEIIYQSARTAIYDYYANQLLHKGKLYRCDCGAVGRCPCANSCLLYTSPSPRD